MYTQLLTSSFNRNVPSHSNVFALSSMVGVAAAVFQIVSFKLLGVTGSVAAVASAISLAAFVVLSGIGSICAPYLATHISRIELALGIYGVVGFGLLHVFGVMPLIEALSNLSPVARLVCLFLLISPFAFISGALLPAYHARLKRHVTDYSSFDSLFVAFHALPAIAIVVIERLVFPVWGWPLAGIVLSAAITLTSMRTFPVQKAMNTDEDRSIRPPMYVALSAISVLTGYVGLHVYSMFSTLVGPNVSNYTMTTAAIFIGLALSPAVARVFSFTFSTSVLAIILVSLLYAFSAPWFAAAGPWVIGSTNSYLLFLLMVCFFLIVPLMAIFGTTAPVMVKQGYSSAKVLATIALSNGVGYLLFLMVDYQLMGDVGWICLLSFFAAISAMLCCSSKGASRFLVTTAVLIVTALVYVDFNTFQSTLEKRVVSMKLADTYFFEHRYNSGVVSMSGEIETIKFTSLYGVFGHHFRMKTFADMGQMFSTSSDGEFLYINGGFAMSSIGTENATLEELHALLPMLFIDRFDRALSMGYGTGNTNEAIHRLMSSSVTVDYQPNIFDWSQHFGRSQPVGHELLVGDVLSYLVNSHRQFNLIVGHLTTPGFDMSGRLFTEEAFELMNNSLVEEGVVSAYLTPSSGDDRISIENAMTKEFEYVARVYFLPFDLGDLAHQSYTLVGSHKPLEIRENPSVIASIGKLAAMASSTDSEAMELQALAMDAIKIVPVAHSPNITSAKMTNTAFGSNYVNSLAAIAD